MLGSENFDLVFVGCTTVIRLLVLLFTGQIYIGFQNLTKYWSD